MQETWVWSLSQEDPGACCEQVRTTTTEAHASWSRWSSTRGVTATRSLCMATRDQPPLTATREKPTHQRWPSTTKNKERKKELLKKSFKKYVLWTLWSTMYICFWKSASPDRWDLLPHQSVVPNLVMINVYYLFICPNSPLLCSESVNPA